MLLQGGRVPSFHAIAIAFSRPSWPTRPMRNRGPASLCPNDCPPFENQQRQPDEIRDRYHRRDIKRRSLARCRSQYHCRLPSYDPAQIGTPARIVERPRAKVWSPPLAMANRIWLSGQGFEPRVTARKLEATSDIPGMGRAPRSITLTPDETTNSRALRLFHWNFLLRRSWSTEGEQDKVQCLHQALPLSRSRPRTLQRPAGDSLRLAAENLSCEPWIRSL
jgi:hypothetical protein